jgi:hypothetical protein
MGIPEYFKKGKLSVKILLVIYVLSFLGASYNHVADVAAHGLFPYQRLDANVPGWLNVYWTALTVIDPLSVLMLAMHIPLGLLFYICVMVSDVAVNYWFYGYYYGLRSCLNFHMICQLLFLLFLLATAGAILRDVKRVRGE